MPINKETTNLNIRLNIAFTCIIIISWSAHLRCKSLEQRVSELEQQVASIQK